MNELSIDAIARKVSDAIAEREAHLKLLNSEHAAAMAAIHKFTDEYNRTGIGICPHVNAGWYEGETFKRFNWQTFAIDLAKHLKRPLIFVNRNSTSADLIVTKRRYTEPLWASLLLTSIEIEEEWHRHKHPITHRLTGDRAYVSFLGTKPLALLDTWLVDCQTAPEMRKALRLDIPPDEMGLEKAA